MVCRLKQSKFAGRNVADGNTATKKRPARALFNCKCAGGPYIGVIQATQKLLSMFSSIVRINVCKVVCIVRL